MKISEDSGENNNISHKENNRHRKEKVWGKRVDIKCVIVRRIAVGIRRRR